MNTIDVSKRSPKWLLFILASLIIPPIIFAKPINYNQIKNNSENHVVNNSVHSKTITLTTLTTRIKPAEKIQESIIGVKKVVFATYTPITSPNTYSSGESTYLPTINAAAAKYGLNPELLISIISCESGFNPRAYNPSGASGIAQFMPSTFYGSWNIYSSGGLWNPTSQIYAMALKISQGGLTAWVCR